MMFYRKEISYHSSNFSNKKAKKQLQGAIYKSSKNCKSVHLEKKDISKIYIT